MPDPAASAFPSWGRGRSFRPLFGRESEVRTLEEPAVGIFTNFRLGNFSPHLLPATAPSYCIDLICIIGLFGYMRSRGFLAPGFWQVILGVYVAKIVAGEAVFIYSLHFMARKGRTDYVPLRGLLALPIAIPMMVALWFYAFGSSELWRARH